MFFRIVAPVLGNSAITVLLFVLHQRRKHLFPARITGIPGETDILQLLNATVAEFARLAKLSLCAYPCGQLAVLLPSPRHITMTLFVFELC